MRCNKSSTKGEVYNELKTDQEIKMEQDEVSALVLLIQPGTTVLARTVRQKK